MKPSIFARHYQCHYPRLEGLRYSEVPLQRNSPFYDARRKHHESVDEFFARQTPPHS